MQALGRRSLLTTAGIGLGLGIAGSAFAAAEGPAADAAQPRGRVRAPIPTQKAKTTVMFKVPKGANGALGAPNAIAMDERGRGYWYGEEEGALGDRKNCEAVLIDFKGKELKRLHTPAMNVSGMAQGGGFIWMGNSGGGFFQVNIDTNEVTQRWHPMSPPDAPSGATHGMAWDDDVQKLWAADPKLGIIARMDPKTFVPDLALKIDLTYFERVHGIAYQKGFVYQAAWKTDAASGRSAKYTDGHGGLIKYDIRTGLPVLYINFEPNSIDPHAVTIDKEGKFIVSDAGFHPGIADRESPYTGTVGSVTLL